MQNSLITSITFEVFSMFINKSEYCITNMNSIIKIMLIGLLSIFVVGCAQQVIDNDDTSPINGTVPSGSNNQELCVQAGGVWIAEANECENISEQFCQEIGGEYNECGSACRNQPDAEICTLQCVAYCSFNNETNEENNNDSMLFLDSYGNEIPQNCSSWFDGCNNCMVSEDGTAACTKMYCEEPTQAKCREYRE